MIGKWTPGPWSAGPHDDAETAAMFWHVFGPSGSIIVEIDEGADNVVSTCIGSGARPENVAANAHLIAAAPDMALLVEVLASLPIRPNTADDVPLYGLDGVYITHGHVRAARAALAKARGEA